MKIAPVADVKARFSRYLEDCAEGPVVVTKNGRPAAVLVAVSDEEELERLVLAHTPRFMALLDSAYERIRQGKSLTHRDFWKAAGKKTSRAK
jgi:prevent-host-death family protein